MCHAIPNTESSSPKYDQALWYEFYIFSFNLHIECVITIYHHYFWGDKTEVWELSR